MIRTLNTNIEIADDKQEKEVIEALDFFAQKFKAKGIIKLKEVYQDDAFIRVAVNKKLKI